MSDKEKNIDAPDPRRSSKLEDSELQDWSKKFGVSADELKKAIEKADLNAKTVKAFFKKGGKNREENL